jgi:hypothetical protein
VKQQFMKIMKKKKCVAGGNDFNALYSSFLLIYCFYFVAKLQIVIAHMLHF